MTLLIRELLFHLWPLRAGASQMHRSKCFATGWLGIFPRQEPITLVQSAIISVSSLSEVSRYNHDSSFCFGLDLYDLITTIVGNIAASIGFYSVSRSSEISQLSCSSFIFVVGIALAFSQLPSTWSGSITMMKQKQKADIQNYTYTYTYTLHVPGLSGWWKTDRLIEYFLVDSSDRQHALCVTWSLNPQHQTPHHTPTLYTAQPHHHYLRCRFNRRSTLNGNTQQKESWNQHSLHHRRNRYSHG